MCRGVGVEERCLYPIEAVRLNESRDKGGREGLGRRKRARERESRSIESNVEVNDHLTTR
jgi:hypothetical protein